MKNIQSIQLVKESSEEKTAIFNCTPLEYRKRWHDFEKNRHK